MQPNDQTVENKNNELASNMEQQTNKSNEDVKNNKINFHCFGYMCQHGHEPWQYTDGCIFLLKELISINPQYFNVFIYQICEIASMRSYPQLPQIQQTIWNNISLMAKSIGDRKFRTHLEIILLPMIEALECKNQAAEMAAANCIQFCNTFIGPKFFKPRLKPDQLNIIQKCPFIKI